MCADACVVRLVVAGFRRERLMALVNFLCSLCRIFSIFDHKGTKFMRICLRCVA